MKLILMGTPGFVVPVFDKIAGAHEVTAVFTRAPKPVGRKKVLTKSPVHEWAESRGLKVFTSIREFSGFGSQFSADFIVVAAYGVILRDNVLGAAPCINIHPSDLPKYRGASPILTAIWNGESESAVCLMQVAAEVDAGGVFMREKFAIGENETLSDIEARVGGIAAPMVLEYLRSPGKYPARPQAGEPTFTRKFTGADERIDWSRSQREIHNQVRSIGGRTTINGLEVKVLETKIAGGRLEILRVQPAGKKPMAWRDFVNGQRGIINFG
jgi:methionyl-tRNA formyltransferase